MTTLSPTTWILLLATVALIAWDLYAGLRWGYAGTISRDVLSSAHAYPIIAFAAGLLCGHLFWPQQWKP